MNFDFGGEELNCFCRVKNPCDPGNDPLDPEKFSSDSGNDPLGLEIIPNAGPGKNDPVDEWVPYPSPR